MRNSVRGALAIALLATALVAAPISATTINFSSLPVGPKTGSIVYPEATFASSTGKLYVGASSLAKEICPLTSSFTCEAALTVTFTQAVENLTFETSGFDIAGATVSFTGLSTAGSFSGSFGGSNGLVTNLASYGSIVSFTISTVDPFGIAYNNFTFNAASVPEPASWALMLFGFGATGAALRSRRKLAITFR